MASMMCYLLSNISSVVEDAAYESGHLAKQLFELKRLNEEPMNVVSLVAIASESARHCAHECMQHMYCLSFLWIIGETENCKLLNVVERDSSFQQSDGHMYFEIIYNFIANASPEDECQSNPCIHGVCNDAVNSYICECSWGYQGINCEIEINECASNPCINGNCNDNVGSYTCNCNPGYEGNICNINMNECSSNPCGIGGTCIDGVNSYSCNCHGGWTGTNCGASECVTQTGMYVNGAALSMHYLNRYDPNSESNCCALCKAELACRSYNYVSSDGICVLKTNKSPTYADATGNMGLLGGDVDF